MNENVFEYSSGIRVLDIMRDPEIIIKKVEKASILCLNCHETFSIQFGKKHITQKCGCGVRIFYPKKEDRGNLYGTKFISKDDYRCDYANK